MTMSALIPAVALVAALASPQAYSQPSSLTETIVAQLRQAFDSRLEDPEAYARQVQRECRGFPEGDLFPYTFPAFAYTSLASSGDISSASARDKVGVLLGYAIKSAAKKVRAPKGDLARLKSYRHHATYLCQLNVGLGAHRLLGGSDYVELHDHLSHLISTGLTEANGPGLRSFPSYSWPFDTIPCLASLALHDLVRGKNDSKPLAQTHFTWVAANALDEETGLPLSRLGAERELPRGCDLSLRTMFLGWFAPERAEAHYDKFVEHFWLERFVAAGFAEWPRGREHFADIDSGPILMGIGSAASAMGIGAARVVGDDYRFRRLVSQIPGMSAAVATLASSGTGDKPALVFGTLPVRPGYVSGTLFGDAVLFMALTWEPWSELKSETVHTR